jgi:hypothetical protein
VAASHRTVAAAAEDVNQVERPELEDDVYSLFQKLFRGMQQRPTA